MVRVMGLLDKAKAETKKYIKILDFINYIAFTQNEEYLNVIAFLKNNHFDENAATYKIDPFSLIIYECDYQTDPLPYFLNERGQDFNFDILIMPLYGDNRKADENFYLNIEQVLSFSYIRELNINFFDENIKKQIHDEIRKLEKAEWESNKKPIKGTWYIQKYFDKSNLTIQEIASLISTISLESVERNKKTEHFAENFKEFISFERYIEQAINEDKLKFNFSHCIDNDKKLHSFLFNDGHIIKGYNDYLAIEPAEPVSQIVFTDSQLSQQVADQQATIDQQAKEIADLKAQLEQQATQPCETVLDNEMETKSLNAVSRLVYVLLDMAEYDLSTHSGNGNTSIIARSERLLQKPLSKKFVSDWIKNAQTVKIEYGKK